MVQLPLVVVYHGPLQIQQKVLLSEDFPLNILGCPRKLGSMVRINGLFHLLTNGVLIGVSYNPLTSDHLLSDRFLSRDNQQNPKVMNDTSKPHRH